MIHNENNHSVGEVTSLSTSEVIQWPEGLYHENNHSVGETKSTGDSATATARVVCFQKLPQHLRLQIFHSLTYRNYLLVSPTCTMFKTDLALSLKNNHVLRCIHVPVDYRTLNEAYERIQKIALTTIVLGQGTHVVEEDEDGDNYLKIKCPVNIVGSPDVLDKSTIIVQGGFKITANGVHVEHLTIRGSKWSGVYGSSSFTLNDLIIEQCGMYGVYAYGSSTIVRCCNVVSRKCQGNGVIADSGASIILEGRETSIYENCSEGRSHYYGLEVWGSSKIQIVSPLTKESISKRNRGGEELGGRMEC